MHSSENRYQDRGGAARNLDAGRDSSSQRAAADQEESKYYAESPPMAPRSYTSARYKGFERRHLADSRPSIGKRAFRTVVRFSFAVLIGVGATLAWQAYGDEAKAMVTTWAPSLGSLLPVSALQSPAAPATLPQLEQQLKPMALDLAIVRRSLEQLAATQDQLAAKQVQMTQNVVALQEVEQDIKQQISALPSPHAVHAPPRKPASSTAPPLPAGQQ
jgi:hypothetical protein